MKTFNKCQLVRDTCEWVVNQAKHVTIDESQFERAKNISYHQFDEFQHHSIPCITNEEYLSFLFVVDAMNFCFWPHGNIEYDFLAGSVKNALLSNYITVDGLAIMTETDLADKVFQRKDIPLLDERARILREVGTVMKSQFNSSFIYLVSQAQNSAVNLLNILTSNFPNFQDHAIYKGHQIHFYKRAQILIGDIWAHFRGKGPGEFKDIDQLTMFADYRVPQTLRHWGVLKYSEELERIILAKEQIAHGSLYEIQIRASTVVAVERLRQYLEEKYGRSHKSIEIDWFLWEFGEEHIKEMPNHHRVLSIYY